MKEKLKHYVSRETYEKYELYIDLIKKWNRKTGLVQKETLTHIWERHIFDCLQIIPYIAESNQTIIDIGSGAGFPGIVIAIEEVNHVFLCESNIRKAVFLQEVIRLLGLSAKVLNNRVETIQEKYDIVVSRACAPLVKLLGYLDDVSRETSSKGVFLKGRNFESEIEEARSNWFFDIDVHPSSTSLDGRVLVIKNLKKKSNK